MDRFKKVFAKVPDPRAPNALHDLTEILFIALAAVLSGAAGPTDMESFGRAKEGLLRHILDLKHGIPSHDTFGRVLEALEPRAFEKAFRRFVVEFAKFNGLDLTGIVAVDGKALRGAYERGRSATPLQMVNVWAVGARMTLATAKAPGRNEAAAAVEVVRMLSLGGCTVTADALHCNRPFAAVVLERGADYVLALKENQAKLYNSVARCFARAGQRSVAERIESYTHDRREKRRATVMRNSRLAIEHRFPGIKAVGRITSRRKLQGKPADEPLVRYFLLSRYVSAKRLLEITRSHWSIENQLHWILDVDFGEDHCRVRTRNAAENLAILRRLALNIAKCHPAKTSMRQKIKRAGWEDAFLISMLAHMR